MSLEKIIKEKIEAALNIAELKVINESHLHRGHAGDNGSGESHFKLIVVSPDFDRKSRVERHKIINSILSDELKNKIHALSMDLRS